MNVRVKIEEYNQIARASEKSKVSMSEIIRRAALKEAAEILLKAKSSKFVDKSKDPT